MKHAKSVERSSLTALVPELAPCRFCIQKPLARLVFSAKSEMESAEVMENLGSPPSVFCIQ